MEEKEITDIKSIAENFNRYFTQMGPTLTKRVDYFSVNFQKHLESYNITQPEKDLSMN